MPVTRDSLIFRVTQNGDGLSWEEFFSIYQPYLFGVVKRSGITDDDARDIVQDVFVTLVRALPQFEYRAERGRFRGWLKTVVNNAMIDWYRRKGRLREVSLNALPSQDVPLADELEWDSSYCLRVLSVATQRIKERSNTVTWYCFEEHSLRRRKAAEVGEECGLTENAVQVNACRTWLRIRRLYVKLDGDFSAFSQPEQGNSDSSSEISA
ncbi:MAG: sigma-70 family RNA polymerase sigma factor [Planctomycetaceae bacterium]|nr:sigma-70 family RNA polymerase sigma factor [Planctomycetaceae bacterium]